MLGADLVFQTPFARELARKTGATVACNADAERLLVAGELVGVWPEGFKGVGKPFSERYKLQRFGRGGFVVGRAARRSPIVPCVHRRRRGDLPDPRQHARPWPGCSACPYVPITPTFPWLGPLGLVPLPSKWIIEFGEPDRHRRATAPAAADDPMLVFNLTDQVRETIQHTLYGCSCSAAPSSSDRPAADLR